MIAIRRRWIPIVLAVLAALAIPLPWLSAQEITASAAAPGGPKYVGDAFDLTVTVDGVLDAKGPGPAAFGEAFAAEFLGGNPMQSQSFVSRGGSVQRVTQLRYTMTYRLRPLREGRLVIPPLEVRAGKSTALTSALSIDAVGPRPSDVAAMELRVSPARVVVEQAVTFDLIVRVRELELDGKPFERHPWADSRPPRLRVPWFEGIDGFTGKDALEAARALLGRSGFALNDYVENDLFTERVLTFELPVETVVRAGVRWRQYTLRRQLVPLRTGKFELRAATLRGEIVTGVALQGRRPSISGSDPVFITHDPVTVEVGALPQAGRPPTYAHAVGRFKVESSVAPVRAKVGDPMKLSVRVWGEGLLDQTLAPLLAKQASLTDGFAVGTATSPKIDGTTKVFEFTIRPRRGDVSEVPPIEFAYYDPAAGEYAVARSKAIPVLIEEATEVGAGDVIGTGGEIERRSSPGEELSGGLLANAGGDELLGDESYDPLSGGLVWLFLLLPPAVFTGLAVFATRRRGLLADPLRVRASRAVEVARAGVADAAGRLDGGDTGAAAEGLHRTLAEFVAARARVPGAGMTAASLREVFAEREVAHPAASALCDAVEMCETMRFGGAAQGDLARALSEAPGWIDALAREELA